MSTSKTHCFDGHVKSMVRSTRGFRAPLSSASRTTLAKAFRSKDKKYLRIYGVKPFVAHHPIL